MNILELINKNDPIVVVQKWEPFEKKWIPHEDPKTLRFKIFSKRPCLDEPLGLDTKDTYSGLLLRSGIRVIVRNAGTYWPNYAEGKGIFIFRSNDKIPVKVIIGWGSGELEYLSSYSEIIVKEEIGTVPVPKTNDDTDLVVQVPLQKGVKLFFGVYRALDRGVLFSLCKGNGVEIGPGPKPQILPNSETEVKYVEQATPDQWEQLYGKETKVPVNSELWARYVVGNADKIPANPGSLDFIFSSHVLEHLANPLGHLSYWASLLKSSGKVIAVVPDCKGCKDYVFQQSTFEELENEYLDGSMMPNISHYQRWGKFRLPNLMAEEIMCSGRSIHVHFYTPDSMNDILKKTYKILGFQDFKVISENNHKDFFVVLTK